MLEAATAQQSKVLEAMEAGLSRLAAGDLSQAFASEYEALRINFNNALLQLQQSMRQVAACVLLALAVLPAHQARVASFGGGFRLLNAAGQPVTDQDFRGRFLLAFFGYTHCPDVCPTMLYTIAQALIQMGDEAGSVQPLFITVDPARDTPAIIGSYVALFSPRIICLSGMQAELRQAEQAYHVYAAPTDPKTGAVTHSAIFYLMAPNGRFHTAINGNLTAAGVAAELRKIIAAD